MRWSALRFALFVLVEVRPHRGDVDGAQVGLVQVRFGELDVHSGMTLCPAG